MLHVSYVDRRSLRGVTDMGMVRASCNIIAVSACWLINRALARTPPGICAGGMMIMGDVVSRTLVDRCISVVVGRGSGWINAGSARLIFGRAPSVLFWVWRRWLRAVVIKLRFAVGSHICIIAGASNIRCIITMGASSLGGLPITTSVATLCSSTFVGVRMALIALTRLLMRWHPLGVPAAFTVVVCNSLVSALRSALGLRFGTCQCCGKSLANPQMRFARVSRTKYKVHR